MAYKLHIPTTRKQEPKLDSLRDSLISVAGMIGRRVINQDGQELGTVFDLICHWDSGNAYPPLTGMVAKVSRRKVWVPVTSIKEINQDNILLCEAVLDLREFKPRLGEVSLSKEVLDHQLIDVNGARVVRASDLYIAKFSNDFLLVGVDVGLKPLIRRLGPLGLRRKFVPDLVIDWSTIQSFGGEVSDGGRQVKLSANRQELRRMRPGELADLLEDLGREERQRLLSSLTPDQAADALEEMEPKQLEGLLRESSPEEGARYLTKMEPDEAADALRDVDYGLRQELLKLIPLPVADKIRRILKYDEQSAGGIMNSQIFIAESGDSVDQVKRELKKMAVDLPSLNAVAITDAKGKLIYDLPLVNLLLAKGNQALGDLITPPKSLTIRPEAPLDEVAEILVESRSSSLVVVDSHKRPIGRILADDLIDVWLPGERTHFPRFFSS